MHTGLVLSLQAHMTPVFVSGASLKSCSHRLGLLQGIAGIITALPLAHLKT